MLCGKKKKERRALLPIVINRTLPFAEKPIIEPKITSLTQPPGPANWAVPQNHAGRATGSIKTRILTSSHIVVRKELCLGARAAEDYLFSAVNHH